MKTSQYGAFRDEMVAESEARGLARAAETLQVEQSLRSGQSVVLAGHPGIGKSYAASRLAGSMNAASGDEASAWTLRCSRADDVRLLHDAAALSDSGTVLLVEDAHLLGLDDLRALVAAAGAARRTLLITLDILPVDPADPESRERSRLLTSLWTDLRFSRVDLSGIGATEAARIIESLSHGAVDVVTRARIVRAAAGNPRLVGELTRDAMHGTRRVGDDQIALVLGPVVQSPRILDFARGQLSGLDDAEEYALVTLAKLGRVPFVRASRLVGRVPLRGLLRRNLVTLEAGSTEMVSANLLYAAAAHSERITENPFETAHTIERKLLAEHRGGLTLTATECAIVAAWWIDTEESDPFDGLSAADAAGIFARAARRTDIWGVPSAGELFARRAIALDPCVLAVDQLSRALAGLGRYTEALAVLESDELEHSDPGEDTNLLAWWMTLLAWHDFDDERWTRMVERVRGWGTVDRALDEWVEFEGYRRRLVASVYDDGEVEMTRFAGDPQNSPSMRLRALRELLPAYSITGRMPELARVIDGGRSIVANLAAALPVQLSGDVHSAASTFLAQSGLARVLVGDDRAGLLRDLESYALRAVISGNELELALINFISGYLQLSMHSPARSEAELARAELPLARKLEPRWTAVARILRATSLFELNRGDEARAIAIGIVGDASTSPWIRYHKQHLDVWAALTDGDLPAARAGCLALADDAGRHSRHVAMSSLHGAFMLGEPIAVVVERADAVPARGKSDIADALQEHLRAELAQDAYRLDAAASRFESLGMPWEATLALRSLHALYSGQSRVAEAAAVARRSELLARAVDLVVPEAAVRPTVETPSKVSTLTRRELEVARLAGDGLTNSEIATRLYLSVRTVESHVLQARAKLGAARRNELGLYLHDLVGQR